jgi:predicted ATPase
MKVIGMAGLPGSGKSRLMDKYQLQGFSRYNDINKNWLNNLSRVQAELQQGRNVAISDIVFCRASRREQLEKELGVSIQWIFFENNPWQCAQNCLYRFLSKKPYRPILRELWKLAVLAIQYSPSGKVLPVVRPKMNRNPLRSNKESKNSRSRLNGITSPSS